MNSEKLPQKDPSNIRCLLITANTGTVFEKEELLPTWVNELADLIRRVPADFIALHCQEVGGKDYERYMHVLDHFIKNILKIPQLANDFTHARMYLDSDYTSQDTFTALGSAYFIRQTMSAQQWNFTNSCFENVTNCQIYTGNLIHVQTIRKEKYPRDFYSESKWSRKGFTQTRWAINDFIFDMVNIHLFHDASNILAVEKSPSIYSDFRRNALEFTLKNLSSVSSDVPIPSAIFGDFNFRLNGHRLIPHIAEQLNSTVDRIRHVNRDEISKIILRNAQDDIKLSIGKKEFNLQDGHDDFFATESRQFHVFDDELAHFVGQLFEYERKFAPSYPYSEEMEGAHSYLRVRCPAWCDRVLLNYSLKNAVNEETSPPIYNTLGDDVCMGDHKPVYLAFTINAVQNPSTVSSLIPNTHLHEIFTSTYNHNNDTNDNDDTINNKNKFTPTNHANNSLIDQIKAPVTVSRKKETTSTSNLMLNEVSLPTNDISRYNVHDYAVFIQPKLLPQWWSSELQQRPTKTINNSSRLWAKVRALAYMASLGHRTGSWYSDDLTEKSPIDDVSSTSDIDDKNSKINIGLTDVEDYKNADLAIPLRRSFSSNAYVKRNEIYPAALPRSCSTTLIESTDHLSDPVATDVSLSTAPSSPPISQSSTKSTSRVYRFLHCTIL